MIGSALYAKIFKASIELYNRASEYARTRGVIVADTKFEFGLLPGSEDPILIDEVLTPDSSRYWPLEGYVPGKPQPSFDKQFLRDWLVQNGFRKGLESGPVGKEGEGWFIDPEVVKGTASRYEQVVELLTS